MKVCVISNYWPPEQRGGGQDVAVMTAHGFRELGHEVVVLTMKPYRGLSSLFPTSNYEDRLKIYRWFPINFYYLGNASQRSFIVRVLWNAWEAINPLAFVVVRLILQREKPDLIISHNVKGMGGLTYRAAARSSTNYTHILHDVVLLEPSGLIFAETLDKLKNLGHKIYALITRWQTKTTPHIVAPSSWLLKIHLENNFFAGAHVQVLLNPVAIQTNSRRPHSGFNVLFLGQLETHKGIASLLTAWSEINIHGKQLTIVGDGSLTTMVEEASRADSSINRVAMKDWLPQSNQEQIWSTTDLLAVPSECLENSPTVITQALARGLRVVASDVGGIPELAQLSPNLQLVKVREPHALAEAITQSVNVEPTAAVLFVSPRDYAAQMIGLIAARKRKY